MTLCVLARCCPRRGGLDDDLLSTLRYQITYIFSKFASNCLCSFLACIFSNFICLSLSLSLVNEKIKRIHRATRIVIICMHVCTYVYMSLTISLISLSSCSCSLFLKLSMPRRSLAKSSNDEVLYDR